MGKLRQEQHQCLEARKGLVRGRQGKAGLAPVRICPNAVACSCFVCGWYSDTQPCLTQSGEGHFTLTQCHRQIWTFGMTLESQVASGLALGSSHIH